MRDGATPYHHQATTTTTTITTTTTTTTTLSSYMKMDLKSEFFDFFQPICFWKAETKLVMNLLEFLRSEVI